MFVRKPTDQDKNCKTYAKGQFAGCLFHTVGYACPTPKDTNDCKKAYEFVKCMMKKHKKVTESPDTAAETDKKEEEKEEPKSDDKKEEEPKGDDDKKDEEPKGDDDKKEE
jgi:hypothetical protein